MATVPKESERFVHALEQVRYEGQLLWQIFGAFLLAHTVFLMFLLQNAFAQPAHTFSPAVFIPATIGMLLCLPWHATYSRSSDFYVFRMAQARECEPKEWRLLHGRGEDFSAGKKVVVDGHPYQVGVLGRILRTKRSVPILIWTFAATYAGLLVWRGPW